MKWIRRLELADGPFMTREETSKYTDPLPDGTARMFSFVMDAKSIITEPAWPDRLDRPGLVGDPRPRLERPRSHHAGGGERRRRADVAGRDARRSDPAEVSHAVPSALAMVRRRRPLLMSRATDETGYVQPTRDALVEARGPSTAYHYNNIRAWRVGADGTVRLAGSPA